MSTSQHFAQAWAQRRCPEILWINGWMGGRVGGWIKALYGIHKSTEPLGRDRNLGPGLPSSLQHPGPDSAGRITFLARTLASPALINRMRGPDSHGHNLTATTEGRVWQCAQEVSVRGNPLLPLLLSLKIPST